VKKCPLNELTCLDRAADSVSGRFMSPDFYAACRAFEKVAVLTNCSR